MCNTPWSFLLQRQRMGVGDRWLFLLKSSSRLCSNRQRCLSYIIWQLTRELCMMEKDSWWTWIGRDSSGKPQWRDQPRTLTGFCGQVQGAACVSPGSSKSERCSYAEWRQKLCPRRGTLGIWTSYSLLGFASSGCSTQQKCYPGGGGTGGGGGVKFFFLFVGWEGRRNKWKDI